MKAIKLNLFILLFGLLGACTYEFPEDSISEPTAGQADFTKMIALGSSNTAGVMDGALYNRGQDNSFAVILAEQMKAVGGGEFNVPSINSENGFFSFGPQGIPLGRLILTTDPNTGATLPAPVGLGEIPTPYTGDKSVINNFGVNGVTLGTSLIPQTGDLSDTEHPAFNIHYARFASNPGVSTLVGDAAAALANGGTFFIFWLGKNDVLGYALTGASNPEILTSDQSFQERLSAALGMMLSANAEAKGAVANIPDINSLPHFNLVPWNALPLSAAQANQANEGYIPYNQGLAQVHTLGMISEEERELRTIDFEAGANAFVMSDESLTDLSAFGLPSIRQSNPTDRATLLLSQSLGQIVGGNPTQIRGVSFPVEDEFVLTETEREEIQAKVNTFNGIIASAVQANSDRLVLVDIHDLLNRAATGSVNAGGVALTASIVPPNGGFSVDGVHSNARASAFIANHFIEAINQKWESNIPKVNPNAYIGNDLPR